MDLTSVEFQMTDNILIARITGDLDHHSARYVREQIDDAMRAFFAKHLVLDLSGMAFMDSSGIGVVMGRYNKVRDKGGTIYITGCSEYVKRILDMAGIFTITRREETTADAVDSIQGNVAMQMKMEVI